MADEPDTTKKRPQHEYNWLQIRRDHATGMSFREIARKYSVRLQTVTARAKSEGWAQQNETLAQQATRKAFDNEATKVAEAVGSTFTEIIAAVGPQVAMGMELNRKSLEADLASGIKPNPKSDNSEYNLNVSSTILKYTEIVRALTGLKPGVPIGAPAEDKGLSIHTKRLVPEKIAVGENGRAI